MNRLIFLLTLFLMGSCGTLKVGEYRTKFGGILTLHADSTFTYDNRVGWNQLYSKGNWYRLGKQLFLTSSFSDGEVPAAFNSFSDPATKEKLLKITGISRYGDDLIRQLEFEFWVNGIKYNTGHADSLRISDSVVINTLLVVVRRKFNGIPYLIRDNVRTREFKIENRSENVFELDLSEIINAYNYISWSGYRFIVKKGCVVDGVENKKYCLDQ